MNTVGIAKRIFNTEINALSDVANRLDNNFTAAVELIDSCSGKIIITGVGKSGQIGEKIASTFASIKIPAIFINPLDAFHGSLGILSPEDILIAISNSGETNELIRLIPYFQNLGIKIIALTGNPLSYLAKNATLVLDVSVKEEADPLNLIPTSSTTVTLVMGDAIACAIMQYRNFTLSDFTSSHPGGFLGKSHLSQNKI